MEIDAKANRRRLIMGVLKIISKNNHEYIFVKQVNKNMFLYKDMLLMTGMSINQLL